MIANLINTALGVALTYVAVLQPTLATRHAWLILVASVIVLAAAAWARRSDYHPWQNNMNLVLGVALAAVAVVMMTHIWPVPVWTIFWIGICVAVLALWAALHRPARAESSAGATQ